MSTSPDPFPGITFPIEMPMTRFQRSSFYLDRYETTQESLLSRRAQTLSIGAGTLDRWRGVYQTPPLSRSEARMWTAFFDALRGTEGCFVTADPGWDGPSAALVAHLQANGGPTLLSGAEPRRCTMAGLPPSSPSVMRAGDYFKVDRELKRLVVDADSNAAGEAVLIFEPTLRILPPTTSAVELIAPTLEARLEAVPEPIEVGLRADPVAFNWVEVDP